MNYVWFIISPSKKSSTFQKIIIDLAHSGSISTVAIIQYQMGRKKINNNRKVQCVCASVSARLCNSFRRYRKKSRRINKVRKVVGTWQIARRQNMAWGERYCLNEFFLHILCIIHAEKMWCTRNFPKTTQHSD